MGAFWKMEIGNTGKAFIKTLLGSKKVLLKRGKVA